MQHIFQAMVNDELTVSGSTFDLTLLEGDVHGMIVVESDNPVCLRGKELIPEWCGKHETTKAQITVGPDVRVTLQCPKSLTAHNYSRPLQIVYTQGLGREITLSASSTTQLNSID